MLGNGDIKGMTKEFFSTDDFRLLGNGFVLEFVFENNVLKWKKLATINLHAGKLERKNPAELACCLDTEFLVHSPGILSILFKF